MEEIKLSCIANRDLHPSNLDLLWRKPSGFPVCTQIKDREHIKTNITVGKTGYKCKSMVGKAEALSSATVFYLTSLFSFMVHLCSTKSVFIELSG